MGSPTQGAGPRPPDAAPGSDEGTPTEAARALAELSTRLALVLEGADEGFWDWDYPSGRVQFSERWASTLGYDLAELPPHLSTWQRLVHPDDLERVTAAAIRSRKGEPAQYADEYRLRHKDGRWVWVLVRGKVVERDAGGNAVRLAGTLLDITARREAEEALRAALAANERLVAQLREALNNVRTLSGFLPICMHCKKVRDDRGFWARIEEFVSSRTDALFSHSLCPECLGKHYPETE